MPAWVAPAIAGASALMGGKSSAKAGNKPTHTSNTSRTTPYGDPRMLDNLLSQGHSLYRDVRNNPYQGTNSYMTDALNALSRGAMGGQGGGGGRGGQDGGRSGGRSRGGGGGGGGSFANQLRNFSINDSPELAAVLGGDFLGANPYLDEVADNIRRQTSRGFNENVLTGIDSRFTGSGRYGSGALARSMLQAGDRFNADLGGQISDLYSSSYESERDRMLEALGMQTQQNIGGRNNLTGVKQSNIAASAQRHAANMAHKSSMAQVGLGRSNLQHQRLMDMYGLGSQYNDATNREAMMPYSLLQDGMSTMLPALQAFGTNTSSGTQQGPQTSPFGNALSQGLSGAASGAMLGNMFGGGRGAPQMGGKG